MQDPTSRRGRILASMGLLQRDPSADARERIPEPFEPSEESVATLSEMGFSRDHALEALETVGTNQVEVAMEYALTHPPSSPATRERRRAAREQRRLEHQRRIEAVRQSSTNEERPNQDEESLNIDDGAQDDSNPPTTSIDDKDKESKAKSESDMKMQLEKAAAKEVKEYLQTVKESLCKTCVDMIERSSLVGDGALEAGHLDELKLSDSDSVTTVISNFLLDLCRTYSPELETKVTTELLRQVKSKLDVRSRFNCRVKAGSETESSFAALVHASVVIFRALPKSRPLVLRQGLVGMLTHCVRNCTLTTALTLRSGKDSSMVWPRWLAPALLLLEVMAQPTSVTLVNDDGDDEAPSKPASKKSEYGKVLAEHKKQTSKLARTTKSIMSKDAAKLMTPKKKKDTPSKKQGDKKATDTPGDEEGKEKSNEESSPLPSIPTFLPLLHTETAEACMLLCLQLLGLRSKKGTIDKDHVKKVRPPPAVVNAILILLLKLLRSRQLASSCLHMGGADLLLCYFSGTNDSPSTAKAALITLILRRMIEDETTLHSLMETEIRSVVTKIYRKQHPSHTSAAQPKVNLKSFMQACAPLICRDPLVFLKAVASSVKIQKSGSSASSLASARGAQVTLL